MPIVEQRFVHFVRDDRGESMVESLVAILIVVLASSLMATMITAAVNISHTSEANWMKTYETKQSLAEDRMAKIKLGDALTQQVSVWRYEAQDSEGAPIYSWYTPQNVHVGDKAENPFGTLAPNDGGL